MNMIPERVLDVLMERYYVIMLYHIDLRANIVFDHKSRKRRNIEECWKDITTPFYKSKCSLRSGTSFHVFVHYTKVPKLHEPIVGVGGEYDNFNFTYIHENDKVEWLYLDDTK